MELKILNFLQVEDFLAALKNSSGLTVWLSYFILGVVAFFENIIPPIPGDTIVIIGSVLVGMKILNFYVLLLFTTIGSTIGFMVSYYVGSLFGKEFFIKKKWINEDVLDRFTQFFEKRAYFLILINRYIMAFRSMVAITSGILKLDYKKVLILATISSITWNYLLIYSGYQAGIHWKEIVSIFKIYNFYFFIFILLSIIAYFVIYHFFIKKQKKA